MNKILYFLTKPLVDAAVIEINKNGIPPKREGRGYLVSIGNEKYPFKLIVTEAAKITGVNLTSNDFSSSESNRNGFQKLTGYSIINLEREMEYFDLLQIAKYKNEVGKPYDSNSLGARCYNDTRSKLKYLGGQIGSLLGVELINNYNEKPNKMAGKGKGFVQKDYILTGFLPKKYEEKGNQVFIKLVFGSFSSEIRFGIDIDVNFSDENNPFNYNRKAFQNESQWTIKTDENFPTNWEDLLDLVTPIFENQLKLLNTFFSQKTIIMNLNNHLDILKYKKQIILQGPPGTGKTKLAKEIAESFVFPNKEIDILYFKNTALILKSFKSRINYISIAIESVTDEIIYFKGTRSVPKFSFSANDLYDCYISKDYLGSNFVEYPQYVKRALVWYIVDSFHSSIMDDQCKLIQFHPSYTYEDFVRGIVADSKGDRIEYKNVNKTLGLFAEDALRNYKASNNVSSATNIDTWIDSKFEEFKNDIEAKLPEEETVLSGDITIFELTDTYFKYAKTWQTPGYLKFTEFKKLVKAIILGDLELSNRQLDKEKFIHAHYRYTYYNALLSKFFENYKYQGESYSEPLKNYVLIIDEINRANLSSVLGELIYALEYRGEAVESMYAVEENNKLILPPNLYIVGTMNTADRSVGHIDYAIRRRFAFVDVLPKDLSEEEGITFDSVLFSVVAQLFETNLSAEFEKKDVQLGHSYFIDKSDEEDGASMTIRLEYEIKPILLEYVKDGVLIGDDIKQKIKDLKTSI